MSTIAHHFVYTSAVGLVLLAAFADAPTKSHAVEREMVHSAVVEPAQDAGSSASNQSDVAAWFEVYDGIRRRAQMTPVEKLEATKLMGIAMSGTIGDKQSAQTLLSSLSQKYERAVREMESLQAPPATQQLHQGYLTYFRCGQSFFSNYLQKVRASETNQLSEETMSQLASKKARMTSLDSNNKSLDSQLRDKYGIEPFGA